MPLILLAEDESSTIDHVRSALSSQGWLVKTVGDRDQALRAASEFAPQLVLINDRLAGAEDLVRTFSRRSGGPGVILLTGEDSGETERFAASPDVDAILTKPLDTGDLIETIRQGLVDGKAKAPVLPVVDTEQVYSSEDIFGDLLDDIVDPEAETEAVASAPETTGAPEPIVEKPVIEAAPVPVPEPVIEEPVIEMPLIEAAPVPEPEPVIEEPLIEATSEAVGQEPEPEKQVESVMDIAARSTTIEESEPTIEEPPGIVTAAEPDLAEGIPVAGLEDLEEVVREGVEAWADSVHPDDKAEDEPDQLTEVAEARPEPEPEPEEDLESKLEDTLAGVLAASLSQLDTADSIADPPARKSKSVDDLLSQALGDLHLDVTASAPAVKEAAENTIDDQLKALAASVETDSSAEIEPADLTDELAELTGFRQGPESIDTDVEMAVTEEPEGVFEEVAEATDYSEDEETVGAAAEAAKEELVSLEETEAPPVATVQGVEFGEYTLEQQIGVGGMASVWKARRKGVEGFEKRVAIKKILPQAAENEDFVEMFIDEAKLAAQLNHSNITHIYDLGKIDDDYFIAMEYVEGRNLRQILDTTRKKQQPVPVGVALFVASQIADALDYAHRSKDFDDAELGLVHRDVSPQNVLISFTGDIKLCDFGIAKAVSKISTTQMGALKGKLQYMSPEQAWGKSIDHRSDLFSLGTLLFEMLTGQRLFSGDSEMAILEAVREADVGTQIIQSPDIPAGVKGVLLRSLAKEPEDRFESAEQLQRGLEELIKAESPAPGPKSLSAFVRQLLDMQAEVPEPEADAEPSPQIEAAEDLAWLSESAPTDDEDETTPWLRRILTRLLPVLLLVAVGGGIIASLMQKDVPATPSPTQQTTQVGEAPALEPASAGEETGVDPQGQPPPTPVAADPTPTPPVSPPPQKPKPQPIANDDPPAADVVPVEPEEEPVVAAVAAATDPELERQVEEDLQRVQELMAGSSDLSESAPVEAMVQQEAEEEPLTLESMWTDVTAATETATDSNPPEPAADPVQPGPGVVEPRVLEFEQPEYTAAAREAGVEGTIRVSVLVGKDGRALEVRLIQGLDSQVGLEEALIDSARNALYQPASQDGTPVEMWYQVAVFFQP